jgi:hypothetical protein
MELFASNYIERCRTKESGADFYSSCTYLECIGEFPDQLRDSLCALIPYNKHTQLNG